MSNLKIQELPAALICDNYIKGERKYNHEQWLVELLNHSPVFRRYNHGEDYIWVESQFDKQPDCQGKHYELDFKRAGCKSLFMHLNLHSYNITMKNGVTIFGAPQVAKDKEAINVYCLPACLSHYSSQDYSRIIDIPKDKREREIQPFLKSLYTPKNLFYIFPYLFIYLGDSQNGINEIMRYIHLWFSDSFSYRSKAVPTKDSYFGFIYEKKLIILQWDGQGFSKVDEIETKKSELFRYCCDNTNTFTSYY